MPTKTWQPQAIEDDALERGDGYISCYEPYSYIESHPNPSSSSYYCSGVRFVVDIPRRAKIISAKYIGFCKYYDDVNCKIYGNNVGNALNFAENPNIIDEIQRPRTINYVSWVRDNLGVEGWRESPPLISIIQELVNHPDWQSGNAIALLFIANADMIKVIEFVCSNNPNFAGKLEITWEEAVPPPTYTLTISSTVGGSTNPSSGSYVHPEGTLVTVTAVPNATYEFDHWTLNGTVSTANPITIMIDRAFSLTAYFKEIPPPKYTLTIETMIGGTTNPTSGSYLYDEGATVVVTAVPDAAFNFNHWMLDGITYTTNPINVTMEKDHTLTAFFSEAPPQPPETFKLTVSTTTGGTTNPKPGIYEYDINVTAEVTAIPDSTYRFDHWLLDGVVRTENPIHIIMDKDYTLQAIFTVTPPKPPTPALPILILLSLPVIGALVYWVAKRKTKQKN